jgi:(p)ppGpp synthase/HD superfamily hydrolase
MNERCGVSDVVARAKAFATAAHAGQVRKYSGEDYITHLAAVASIVEAVEHTPEMLAAAWLHDVVEETKTTVEDIRLLFGVAIANFVDQLTDVSRSFDGNRARRKALDRAHLANASQEAQTIKLADLIDNSRSIMANDPVFADVYMREKAELLEVMTGGNPQLRDRANLLIGSFLRKRPVAKVIASEGLRSRAATA